MTSGKSHSVKDFVEEAFKYIDIKIAWRGKGLKEIGYNKKNGEILIKVDPIYFRPTEINELRGDYTKAKKELGWKPKTSFKDLVKEMIISDLKEIK
jgi:GDPmannose 4,6-dehydratase